MTIYGSSTALQTHSPQFVTLNVRVIFPLTLCYKCRCNVLPNPIISYKPDNILRQLCGCVIQKKKKKKKVLDDISYGCCGNRVQRQQFDMSKPYTHNPTQYCLRPLNLHLPR